MDNNYKIMIDKYDLMEDKLKDDARSIKFIKNLGKELIEKMRMIDKEKENINPKRKPWKELSEENRNKLLGLCQLKTHYRCQYDMITVVLNKSNELIDGYTTKRLKEQGLEDKFFIDIKED